MSYKIPKQVYQTCPDKKTLDPTIVRHQCFLRSINPEYGFTLFNNEEMNDYIKNYNDEIYSAYMKIDKRYGAALADVFRYVVMYDKGGIYLDIKSGCQAPFSSIINPDDEYLLSFYKRKEKDNILGYGIHSSLLKKGYRQGEFIQWVIISAPGHPFLKKVIKNLLINIYDINNKNKFGHIGVLKITGPIMYTLAIDEIIKQHTNYRITELHDDHLFNYSVFKDPRYHAKPKDHYSKLTFPIILDDLLSNN